MSQHLIPFDEAKVRDFLSSQPCRRGCPESRGYPGSSYYLLSIQFAIADYSVNLFKALKLLRLAARAGL
jgi:hypothetical protein